MNPIRAVIADDEPPARRKLLRLLAVHRDVTVEGEAATGNEVVALLRRCTPDALFLDVQMPGLDGFQALQVLGDLDGTAVIFVTAYDEYAVQAFEVPALDYLLKPVTAERLAVVIDRLRKLHCPATAREPECYWRRILVRGSRAAYFVPAGDIDWIEADRNYLVLHSGEREHLIRATLDAFSGKLDPGEFARVNRSTAVNLNAIRELQPWTHGEYRIILKNGRELVWSRRYVSKALDRFLP